MIWYIALKDLKRMIRDKKALTITILMPTILTLILGFSVGQQMGGSVDIEPAKIAIVSEGDLEEDQKKLRQLLEMDFFNSTDSDGIDFADALLTDTESLDFKTLFIQELLEQEDVQKFISYEQLDMEQAKKRLQQGNMTAVVVFPEHLNYHCWLNIFMPFTNRVEIDVIQNPNQALRSNIVKTIVTGYTDQLSAGMLGKNVLLEAGAEAGVGTDIYPMLEEFVDETMRTDQHQIKLTAAGIEERNPVSGFQYYAAGMGAMFMLFSAAFAASYTLGEKQNQTFERIRGAGIGLGAILGGRYIATVAFTFLQLGFLITATAVIFQLNWGNPVHLLLLTGAVSLTVACLAVLLSMINLVTNSEKVSNLFQGMLVPIASLLGGSFIPNSALPELAQNIGNSLLNGASLSGYVRIVQGYPLGELQGVFYALFINGLVLLLLTWLLKKTLGVKV